MFVPVKTITKNFAIMKTIKINLYKYSELPTEDAKERARNWFTTEMEYSWANEAIESMKAFLEKFHCSLNDYSINFLEPFRNDFSISYPKFLRSSEKICFIESVLKDLGSFNPETLKRNGDCKLTGMCFDENLIEGLRIEFSKGETDMQELIQAGLSEWEECVRKDYEFQFTEEYLKEVFAANEYEFNEDGSIH